MSTLDKERFWNQKILRWDHKRYNSLAPFKSSIFHRLQHSLKMIEALDRPPQSVIEFGCGTGRLASYLSPGVEYRGYDFAQSAIELAQEQFAHNSHVKFYYADLTQIEDSWEADLIIGLGFIDWITQDEFERLLSQCKCRHVIFSYSNQSNHWLIRFYHLYSKIFFKSSYNPRFYSTGQLIGILKNHGYSLVNQVERQGMLFGGIIVARK